MTKLKTRIFNLHHHLSRVRKDTKSVVEYMREICPFSLSVSFSNELATACSPINNDLSGLDLEFCEISATIRASDSPISYAEIFDKLLDRELFLKQGDLNGLPPRSQHLLLRVSIYFIGQTQQPSPPTHQ